jgi:hypothetical protein
MKLEWRHGLGFGFSEHTLLFLLHGTPTALQLFAHQLHGGEKLITTPACGR